MKIAQVAPIEESVPPKYYGGTERVVSYLTEELVNLGHDVTLFASGDSSTSAQLVSVNDYSLRLGQSTDSFAYYMLLISEVMKRAEEFDVIHFHIDYLHFPLSRQLKLPQLTTLHGRLDIPVLQKIYREFYDMPVISISNNQRMPLPSANWLSTVYNGVPEHIYTFQSVAGKYLAFLGRISPEKGIESAINIAIRAGMPLKIAAKVDKVDQQYFNDVIKPLLRHPLIEYIGEINELEKNLFLGNAYAMLFPIDWPEPFGLVMIEAMACGTPTIAYQCGSVPEVISHGETGLIVKNVEQALKSVEKIEAIDRHKCRQIFETRFSARRMANDYANAYSALIAQKYITSGGYVANG
ncbi:MAG: glycosyltransferase family 4 protein [Gammaproteobacteria bacterium]|nr:glycosyltransferase family 4 protein [Gammaproteobacteria bacterium]